MKIFFLRHGRADWPNWTEADDARPLTEKGRKEMKRLGKFLRALRPKIARVLSSPLPRAHETAEIAAKHLELALKIEPALGKNFSVEKLRKILRTEKAGNLMLVGHEPDLSKVIRELTGGKVKMEKAGLAVVEIKTAEGAGELLCLLPPKIVRRSAGR